MKKQLTGFIAATAALAAIPSAHAFSFEHIGSNDLSIAGGIASPSESMALTQNPAGLAENARTSMNLGSSFSDSSMTNPSLEGTVLLGNSQVGGGVGVIHWTSGLGSTFAEFGVGVRPSQMLSLGVSGTTDTGGNYTALNAGAFIGSSEDLRFGVSVHDFTHSTREYGVGFRYGLGMDMFFVTDATLNSDFGGLWLMPGLGMRYGALAVTAGYGFGSSTSSSSEIPDGFGAGASYRFGTNVSLAAYYKQLNYFTAELSIGL